CARDYYDYLGYYFDYW
nr:immunoglobulin heavy chain junction region [Mus musculus]MBK4190008.1 immunoglobulin heavy chain junction region [Mus musculus]